MSRKMFNFKVLFIGVAIIVLVLWISGLVPLWINGISDIANNVEDYDVDAYPVHGEYAVKLDLSDFESNEGKVVYDDGENQIYVSKVYVHNKSDYQVSFRSSGNYSLHGATLVSGVEHARTPNGFTNFFHVNATATYQGNSFKIYKSGSSGLNYRDGDAFGFYLFPHDQEIDVDINKNAVIEVKLSNLYMNKWEKN